MKRHKIAILDRYRKMAYKSYINKHISKKKLAEILLFVFNELEKFIIHKKLLY